ncbi:RNA polymerase sigma-70 factor (ECF subfamily) [Tumebacillus sp. BK434]|uniref:RNA polymerase sigma factor n=1 Tax=Tumebacillus sp. BK434 TaxID=2512169 RepID=UPI00104EB098|nr:RNA polymerase sigma factor [Tumebacillus sp. BK434]TCP57882.1 RNA polymerase sigma-70 factor (ECF subfamily) [Tumebacillus sp. BK434]
MTDIELESLILSAMQGKKEAFARLIERFRTYAFQTAYGFLQDRMDAEDVVQEAFTKAYFSIGKLQSPHAFHSWFSRIVTNLCLDRLKRRRYSLASERIEEVAEQRDSASGLSRSLERLTIEEALGRLSPEMREVLVLRELQGFDYQEIAEILRIPIGTVRSRLHAGRLHLRKHLAPE